MQQIDAGIIALVKAKWDKAKYKIRLWFRVFNNIDMGRKSILQRRRTVCNAVDGRRVECLSLERDQKLFWALPDAGSEQTEPERGIYGSSTVESMEWDAFKHGVTVI